MPHIEREYLLDCEVEPLIININNNSENSDLSSKDNSDAKLFLHRIR